VWLGFAGAGIVRVASRLFIGLVGAMPSAAHVLDEPAGGDPGRDVGQADLTALAGGWWAGFQGCLGGVGEQGVGGSG
jgi:hypothetical protein